MKALFLIHSPLSVGRWCCCAVVCWWHVQNTRRRPATAEDHLKPALVKEIMRKCHAKRYRGIWRVKATQVWVHDNIILRKKVQKNLYIWFMTTFTHSCTLYYKSRPTMFHDEDSPVKVTTTAMITVNRKTTKLCHSTYFVATSTTHVNPEHVPKCKMSLSFKRVLLVVGNSNSGRLINDRLLQA